MDTREIVTLVVVGVASAILGFILQLTAYEEADRDKRGAASAFGGLLLGSLSAIVEGGDLLVPFVGFGGGGLGATLGWLFALKISRDSLSDPKRRAALLFLHQGPEAVQEFVVGRDAERKAYSIRNWAGRYGELVRDGRDTILSLERTDDALIEMTLRLWMRSLADMFNYLMVDIDTPNAAHWHLRVSLIAFTFGEDHRGSHWISYSGTARPHDRKRVFDADTIAYKVLSGEYASPASRKPDDVDVPDRGSEQYWAFSVYRVTEWLALSVDWEPQIMQDENLDVLQSAVASHLVPGIADLAGRHSRSSGSR